MSHPRTTIASKIRALLSKTVSAGCTEDEALAAASLAAKLMAEHDLSYADLGDLGSAIRGEAYGARKRDLYPMPQVEVLGLLGVVGEFWDCAAIYNRTHFTYFGTASDTEHACNMADLLRLAIDTEWFRFAAERRAAMKPRGKAARRSFVTGIAHRLSERLTELKHERSGASVTGRELVVIRSSVVMEKFDLWKTQKGISVGDETARGTYVSDPNAYLEGHRAGDRVGIGRKEIAA